MEICNFIKGIFVAMEDSEEFIDETEPKVNFDKRKNKKLNSKRSRREFKEEIRRFEGYRMSDRPIFYHEDKNEDE